ncbi:MAG: N-6 DNA methylase [Gaiellales bacterium]
MREQARHDENLNPRRSPAVFRNIEGSAVGEASEHDLKGLFDDLDVNSSKLGPTVTKRNEKLVKLLDAIGDLDLNHADSTIDAFGDAYEFLMTMYASNSPWKSGGEFFTPQEESRLLARITVVRKDRGEQGLRPCLRAIGLAAPQVREGARPAACGSASSARRSTSRPTTSAGSTCSCTACQTTEQFDIAHGDTLTDPQHEDDEPFEAIVSSPPYSIRWDGDANPLLINDPASRRGCAGAEVEGRPRLHAAHAELAGGERHRSDRRVPRCALPRRCRAEDPQVPGRQQLRSTR